MLLARMTSAVFAGSARSSVGAAGHDPKSTAGARHSRDSRHRRMCWWSRFPGFGSWARKIGLMHFWKYAKDRCWFRGAASGLLTTGGLPSGFVEPPQAARVPSNVIESAVLRSTVISVNSLWQSSWQWCCSRRCRSAALRSSAAWPSWPGAAPPTACSAGSSTPGCTCSKSSTRSPRSRLPHRPSTRSGCCGTTCRSVLRTCYCRWPDGKQLRTS